MEHLCDKCFNALIRAMIDGDRNIGYDRNSARRPRWPSRAADRLQAWHHDKPVVKALLTHTVFGRLAVP